MVAVGSDGLSFRALKSLTKSIQTLENGQQSKDPCACIYAICTCCCTPRNIHYMNQACSTGLNLTTMCAQIALLSRSNYCGSNTTKLWNRHRFNYLLLSCVNQYISPQHFSIIRYLLLASYYPLFMLMWQYSILSFWQRTKQKIQVADLVQDSPSQSK